MSVPLSVVQSVLSGHVLTLEEALDLARGPRSVLFDAAEAVTRAAAPRRFSLCAITNVRSGACTEDCRWCAQSGRSAVPGVPIYPVLPEDRILASARRAADCGIRRFSLVASGRKPPAREVRTYAERVRALVRALPDTEVCVSLGLLNARDLAALARAGVRRVHCNLETSARFFPEVCSTHTREDKVKTLKLAREAGLDICSGALLGMGETLADRIELARDLRRLDVRSVPLNVLQPIPGTPLEGAPSLTDAEFLEAAALFRLILPHAHLRFAGGRLRLSDDTVRTAMRIGVNAAICGDLLTTPGTGPEAEARRFAAAGYLPEA